MVRFFSSSSNLMYLYFSLKFCFWCDELKLLVHAGWTGNDVAHNAALLVLLHIYVHLYPLSEPCSLLVMKTEPSLLLLFHVESVLQAFWWNNNREQGRVFLLFWLTTTSYQKDNSDLCAVIFAWLLDQNKQSYVIEL